MAVYRTTGEASEGLERPVVAIGNFDGVHRGHQYVFDVARSEAEERGVDAAALTFRPHPARFFRPDLPPFRLTTDAQKFQQLQALGVDVIALHFDESMATLSPEEFVEEILNRGIGVSTVLVGEGFVFARDRSGNTDDLERLCAERDIDVRILETVASGDEVISSTRIRNALRSGQLQRVTKLLGRPYSVAGKVVHGDARGRELGFPTANVDVYNELLPPEGIFAAELMTDDFGAMRAAAYIGTKPTFDGKERSVEAFVLDWDEIELYDVDVELSFHEMIRPDRKFEDSGELVAQMKRDVAAIRHYFTDQA